MNREEKERREMMYTDFSNVKEAMKLFKERILVMEKVMAKKEVIKETGDILRKLKEVGVDGKPLPILAGSLYVASILSGYRITQKEICLGLGISDRSLRKSYKIVAERLYNASMIGSPTI